MRIGPFPLKSQLYELKLTSFPNNRKTPWRLSSPQKARQRKRLRSVDRVVDTVSAALERNGQTSKAVSRWFAEMPREEEMLPKDKYTLFDKKEKSYRKSIHSMFSSHFYFPYSHQLVFITVWIG